MTCTVCDISKDPEQFPIASITKTGRAGECKSCKSIRIKKQRKERESMLHEMFGGMCNVCNLKHDVPSFFDFHHVDTQTKHREVKQIICGSLKTLMEEVSKCIMVCPNCHREEHLKGGWK